MSSVILLLKMARILVLTNFSLYCVYIVFTISFLAYAQAKISEDRNTLTFGWYENVTAEKVEADSNRDETKNLVEFTELYNEINGTFFLQGTNFTSQYHDSISWRKSGGFVDTVFYSYKKHHNLIIRPDDVWTAIIVQFSLYINANAEALRHSFVNFEGKKKLEVTFYAPIDRISISEFIDKIAVLIEENIDPNVSSWVKPNFTTTTVNDKLTAGAALMATVQNYFEYDLLLISCGIPEVTILGNVDDWKQIRQRIEKLKEFEVNGQDEMAKWSLMLGHILDEFIKVKQGTEKDDEFWEQAIRVDYENINVGCGEIEEIYLNGWITAFSAFDSLGKWQTERNLTTGELINSRTPWLRIRTDNITPGIVHAPIKIFDQFAKPEERVYTGAIITGHMGHSVKKDEVTLQPLSGWAMTITNKPPDYLVNNKAHSEAHKEQLIFID